MKLLGLEGKGLLISVGITIIMCGAVTYYCHMRVKNVEIALMKQNQVLTSFITNVQTEIRKGGLSDNRPLDLSSPEARDAVKHIENSKIEVSDDEDDDSEDDDSDTDESDDDDSEDDAGASETGASETGDNNTKIKIGKEDMKYVDIHDNFLDIHVKMSSLVNGFNTNSKIIELTDLEEITDFANLPDESEDDSDDDSISDTESINEPKSKPKSENRTKHEIKKINIAEVTVDNKKEHLINKDIEPKVVQAPTEPALELVEAVALALVEAEIDLDSGDFIKKIVKTEDKEKEKTSNINKMKIDDLREKAILSGLGTVDSLKKLKKSDLITLLTENK